LEIRKIFKNGNSLVLSLPAKALNELGLTEGDRVLIEVSSDKEKSIVIRPLKIAHRDDDAAGIEDFLKHYGEALDRLDKNEPTDR
jgi:antitoxin component of MazEF toxin-antitoxin module